MLSVALPALAGGLPPLLIERLVDHSIPKARTVELLLLCAAFVSPLDEAIAGGVIRLYH